MNSLVSQTHFTDTTATSAQGHHTVLTSLAQGVFLENLAEAGNVRLACRAAGVSPQTVYRARRRSEGFARAWDTACASARVHAEEALADRALNGWEEPVFYHGEEIARRRRFSDRLLLAHLARLDAMAARADVVANMAVLDDQIAALKRGEALPDVPLKDGLVGGLDGKDGNSAQDPVPCVPSCRVSPPSSSEAVGRQETPSSSEAVGRQETPSSSEALGPAQPCADCGGRCDDPRAGHAGFLGPDDCQWLGNRIARMNAARPPGAKQPHEMVPDVICSIDGPADPLDMAGAIEALQLEAFEAEGHQWWLVTNSEELIASALFGDREHVPT